METKRIDALRAELARDGEVAIGFNRTKQFLRNPAGFLGLRRSSPPSPQVIVNNFGLWAAVDGFPEGGVPWARILEVHITKVNVSSYIDVSIRTLIHLTAGGRCVCRICSRSIRRFWPSGSSWN